ncbi:hypothetical protein SEA_TYPHA_90 [Mycobacterium phage Typha]|uniref:Uncharacterized protein n=1 Tax=Mycobacterium phage Typha TaxID=2517971 RepID=A0A482JAR5_9CAUD|nr:hypothetical protein KCH40_gp079 [Mycobacterium phage Typha]QBP29745.1 hypothetical protein SEA_TYPHA_90 [Mycobacterium phage Typha]
MDVYVVLYLGPLTPHVVGVSAKLQGAELIRANVATKRADDDYLWHQHGRSDVVDRDTALWRNCYRAAYDHMTVSNHDLKDD